MVTTAPAGAKTRRTGSYGRVNFSERGEGRDDSEYLDFERSKEHDRALSSTRSDKGDVAIARRKSKSASIRSSVDPEVTTAPQERRRERREASSKQSSKALRSRRSEAAPIASSRSKADAQNDIDNLGREFELGFIYSDRRSKHSITNTNIQSPYYTGEPSSANSIVDKITGAPKQSDRSAVSDVNIHKSLSSVLAEGGRSRKSSNKVSTANSRSIRNNHSSKKERTSISTSKRKKLQQSEVEYWTGLSVRVAMAVIQTNGSEKMAQKASSIILIEGRRQSAQERSSKMMRALSAKLSVAMLEAKADQKTILAVMNAVSEYDNNQNAVKSAKSMSFAMSFDDSSTIKTDPNVHVDLAEEIESAAPSVAPSVAQSVAPSVAPSVALSLVPTIRSNRSKAVSTVRSNRSKAVSTIRSNRSVTPSMASKRSKLQTIEMQILEKQMAIEEAELRNQEREKEFNERIAAMTAATNERLAALDATKDSLLEEEESTLAYQQVILADEWQRTRSDVQQEDNGNEKVNAGNEKVNAFQSGLDDFVLGFNEQMTALDIAAKEGLAGLDATKTSLLEKSGLTQADRRVDATAQVSRSANKENNGTGAVSAIQSGIGGFVLGVNQQLAALAAAAKEKLAGLDATKTAGSIVGSTKGDRKDVTADESRNINEDVKQEDNGSALQMFKSRLLHSFDCGDGPKVNSSSSSGKGDDLALWEI